MMFLEMREKGTTPPPPKHTITHHLPTRLLMFSQSLSTSERLRPEFLLPSVMLCAMEHQLGRFKSAVRPLPPPQTLPHLQPTCWVVPSDSLGGLDSVQTPFSNS